MIVIEGIEGAGKSSAIETVIKTLSALGIKDVVTTREPGGTPIAETMRKLLKEGIGEEIPTIQTEVLLMYAARSQLLENVIKPSISKGQWVVSDRHNLSSLAYQGGGRGVDKAILDTITRFCVGDFKPDLTLFLDVSLEVGESRVVSRGKKDRFEQEEKAFFKRVREAYLDYAKKDRSIVTIDANQTLEEVQSSIEHILRARYDRA